MCRREEIMGPFMNRVCRTKLARNVEARFVHPLTPKKWVFILGCYNSGTTLLSRILSSHPSGGGLPYEGVMYTDSLPWPENLGWTRLWYMCEEAMRIPENKNSSEIADRIKRHWKVFSNNKNPEFFVEKSVANACRSEFLERYFSPAYFIHIVRNGFAVSEGIRRKAKPRRWGNNKYSEGYPIGMCAKQWLRTEELIEQSSVNLKNFLSVRYEALCDTPAEELNRICNFIGIEKFSSVYIGAQPCIQHLTSKITNKNADNFRGLSDKDIKEIKNVAMSMLISRGYLKSF